ncbi:hypothetical protein ACU8KH_05619 [Lachancea thermotolerans]
MLLTCLMNELVLAETKAGTQVVVLRNLGSEQLPPTRSEKFEACQFIVDRKHPVGKAHLDQLAASHPPRYTRF